MRCKCVVVVVVVVVVIVVVGCGGVGVSGSNCRMGEVGSTLFAKASFLLCRRDYLR